MIQRAYRLGHGTLPQKSLSEIREYYQKSFSLPCEVPYQEIAVGEGAFIRLHYPLTRPKCPSPVVIYLRASAYVLGSLDDTDYFCHFLAQHLQCTVAAIEPRLAPEYKFPLPFEDAVACVTFLHDHHRLLSIDPQKMALWGESSGGNMAAALSHYFSTIDKKFFRCQILFYPMLDYARTYPSKISYGNGYLMDTALSDWFMAQYLKDKADVQDIRVSPLLAQQFDHLPPTVLIGAQYDPMQDEGVGYIQELAKSGVSVHALFLPGMIHGFLGYALKLAAPQSAQFFAASMVKSYIT
jgi:acetyl esterase